MAMLVNVCGRKPFSCVFVNYSLQSSNNTSVAISLPTIGRDLDIEEAQLQWLVIISWLVGRLLYSIAFRFLPTRSVLYDKS